MALQTINIGTLANDGTGDPLRTAMDKINDNFAELEAGYVKVTDLGNLGASETIDNANGPQQKGTLDASTLIAAPEKFESKRLCSTKRTISHVPW